MLNTVELESQVLLLTCLVTSDRLLLSPVSLPKQMGLNIVPHHSLVVRIKWNVHITSSTLSGPLVLIINMFPSKLQFAEKSKPPSNC